MLKIELNRNKWIVDTLNKTRSNKVEGYYLKGNEEDFEPADGYKSGITNGEKWEIPYEFKTIKRSERYGDVINDEGEFEDFFKETAGRNRKCRWDNPDALEYLGERPIHVLNAEGRYGNKDNGKWNRMKAIGAGLVILCGYGLIVYDRDDLENAVIPYSGEIMVTPTTEFSNEPPHWEKKVWIDLSMATGYVRRTPPADYLK